MQYYDVRSITPCFIDTAFPRNLILPSDRSQDTSRSPPRSLTCFASRVSGRGLLRIDGRRLRANGVASQYGASMQCAEPVWRDVLNSATVW